MGALCDVPHREEKQAAQSRRKPGGSTEHGPHMWGVLGEKMKIMGENTPGTVKARTIWSFIVTGRGKSEPN